MTKGLAEEEAPKLIKAPFVAEEPDVFEPDSLDTSPIEPTVPSILE